MGDGGAPVSTLAFVDSDEEARKRFLRFRSADPFPDISPALLNSADIYDYVRVTGIISPFHQEDLIKPACYQVRLLGQWIEYDESKEDMSVQVLNEGDRVLLKPNGIAFATLEPMFRVPEYLALRFNLTIVHAHRGLLVGTGPLVDPGFEGRLLLPLHNLTANAYSFLGGEGVVWFEFTKLSPNPRWQEGANHANEGGKEVRIGQYKPFPEDKKITDPLKYLQRALASGVVKSSIPAATERAQRSAEQAQMTAKEAADDATKAAESAEAARDTVTRYAVRFGVGAIIAIVLAALALAYTFYALVQNDRALVHDSRVDRQSLTVQVIELQQRVQLLEQRLNSPSPKRSSSASPSP